MLGLLVGNTGTNKYQQIQTPAGVSGMCAGYNTSGSFLPSPPSPAVASQDRRRLLQSLSSVTFDQCRQACDESLQCMGFSFGVIPPSPPPSPPPPSPPPPVTRGDRRRQLLESSGTGDCYLMTTSPTAVDTATQYTGSASCYAKGDPTASDCDTGNDATQGTEC
jgi:hypothetical protein